MATKLRLLLDECIPVHLMEEIRECSGVLNTESINADHELGNRKTPDDVIVNHAKKTNRVVVTVEGRLNEKKYPICTHPGIIVLKAVKRHEVDKIRLFKRFMQSGHRNASKHAVTRLRVEGSNRRELAADGSIREIPLNF